MKTSLLLGTICLLGAQAATAQVTYRVYATREGLVGATTANGHVIKSRDHFCALPSKTVLNSNGGTTYTVTLSNPANGKRKVGVPIWDVGPWNTKDNYWHSPRELWPTLPRGKPEAQAAYEDGFNGGKDGSGRMVQNPAGIDLADGTFWDDLGMVNNGSIDVTYNWESNDGGSSGVDACARGNGYLDIFTRGGNNHLWKKSYSSSAWSAWADMGENLTSDPSCVSKDVNSVDVFFRGGNGDVWKKTWTSTGGWVGATPLGGAILGSPDSCARTNTMIDVFARGTDNHLWRINWIAASGWGTWADLGENLTSSPSAVSKDSNTVDVFFRGGNGDLWKKTWTAAGGWQAAVSLGGEILGAPDAASQKSTSIDIFVRGTDNHLYKKTWDASTGWSGFTDMSGTLAADPGATAWANSRVDVFHRGTDGNIYQKYWTGATGWSGFLSLGHE